MMNKKISVYLAGGWFTENTNEILTEMENKLRSCEHISPYFPRHDGIKLKEGEIQNHELRKRVFTDNVTHIDAADFVLTNMDGQDGFYDTGTVWELGYAMSKDIPVVAFDTTGTVSERLPNFAEGFEIILTSFEELGTFLESISQFVPQRKKSSNKKVLLVSPSATEVQRENAKDVAAVIIECKGSEFRWVDQSSKLGLYTYMDDIFQGVELMVAVIDDRDPLVSWMMGQAYQRGIPTVSYTDFDYGVNVMLAVSITEHIKGKNNLKAFLQKIKREGIPTQSYDTSNLKCY